MGKGKDKNSTKFTRSPTNKDKLKFSFEHMEERTGFSVNCCDQEHCSALAKRLFSLSKITWQQTQNAGRHGLGTEKISQNAIKTKLPNSVTPDTQLLAFRYHSKNPMVGYRKLDVFYILFIDKDFSLYDHA